MFPFMGDFLQTNFPKAYEELASCISDGSFLKKRFWKKGFSGEFYFSILLEHEARTE